MTIECMACGHIWDTADSDADDMFICHKCDLDNSDFYDKTIELKGLTDIVLEEYGPYYYAKSKSKYPITKSSCWHVESKYNSICKTCGYKIRKGDMIYYFPYAKIKVLCNTCGPIHADRVNL